MLGVYVGVVWGERGRMKRQTACASYTCLWVQPCASATHNCVCSHVASNIRHTP